MKKTIFAVAVSAALGLGAAQAETVLYGSIRTGVDYTKNHNGYAGINSAGWTQGTQVKGDYLPNSTTTIAKRKNGFNMVDTGSRIGLKGGEDLGNGLQAIFQLEWGFNGVEGAAYGGGFNNRLAFIGLQSEQFGTVVLGRLENPFDKVVVAKSIDNMNEVYRFGGKIAANYILTGGAAVGYDALTNSLGDGGLPARVGNAIAYVSPTWSGFSFNVAAAMDSPDAEGRMNNKVGSTFGDNNSGIDMYTINASYKHESGFNAGLGFLSAKRIGNRTVERATEGTVSGNEITAYGNGKNAYGYYTNNNYNEGATGSASVDSRMFSANLGFENDTFKVGVSALTGKGRTENLVRTVNYAYNNAGSLGYASENYSIGKSDQKATGFDIGGAYYFNQGMTSVKLQAGRMSGTTKELRRDNGLTASATPFNQTYWGQNGSSAVNGATGAWNDHKNTVTTWAVGFEHKLSQRTKAWVEYEGAKATHKQTLDYTVPVAFGQSYTTTGQRKISESRNRVNVGIRHDF